MTFPSALPILSLLVWTPALGALFAAIPAQERVAGRRFLAVVFALLTLGLGILVSAAYGSTEIRELYPWIVPLGSSYELSVDGPGSLFVVWIPIASLVALLSGAPLDRRAATLVLLGESALLGLATARDVVLFLSFFGAALTALALLHPPTRAMKSFFFFQSLGLASTCALSLVWLHLAFVQTGFPTAEIGRFPDLVTYPDFELRMFLLGAVGASLLAPLVPFASWLQDSIEALPTPGRVLLLGGWSLTPALVLDRLVVSELPLGRADGAVVVVWLGALATLHAGLFPYRGENRRSWVPLLVGFQGLAIVGLVSEGADAVAAGRLLVLQLGLGLTALALWSHDGDGGGDRVGAPTPRARVPALLLIALVLSFPAADGLPPALVVLREQWDRFPAATVLASAGALAMAVRLAKKLPSLERAAGSRRNLLLVLPVLAWSLLLVASPRASARLLPAGADTTTATEIEEEE
jgi:NADH-quinone oxidoreductase subunit M